MPWKSELLALTGLRLGRAGCDPLGKRASIIVLSWAYRSASVSLNCRPVRVNECAHKFGSDPISFLKHINALYDP